MLKCRDMGIIAKVRFKLMGPAKIPADMPERVKKIEELAKRPMTDDKATRRVEIIMLKFKEEPKVIDKAISNIIHFTDHPFKLTVYDNRLNPPNTSKIWNKLVSESSCDYIMLIDSDAFVPKTSPCWLTRMMESIDEAGLVLSVGDNVSGGNHATRAAQYPSAEKYTFAKFRGAWTGYCFLFKKSLWQEHPFDERFYMYGQDSAWGLERDHEAGAILRKDVLVRHLHSYSFKKAAAAGELDRDADKQYARALYKRMSEGNA